MYIYKINKILIYSILDNYYYKCVFKFIIFDILLSILEKMFHKIVNMNS